MSWREKPCKHCKQIHTDSTGRWKCWWLRYPERAKTAQSANRKRYNTNRRQMIKDLREQPCTDCGKTFPWFVMDFDHVRGTKAGNVSTLIYFSNKRLVDEIGKCDLVCANCHKIRTHNRREHKDGIYVNKPRDAAKVKEAVQ